MAENIISSLSLSLAFYNSLVNSWANCEFCATLYNPFQPISLCLFAACLPDSLHTPNVSFISKLVLLRIYIQTVRNLCGI